MRLSYATEETPSVLLLCGYIFLLFLCLIFTFQLITVTPTWIFLDYPNLLIHEAGHLIFAFAGRFIMLLGGTISQLLMPLAFMVYFYLRKSYMSALFCLFWIGDNLINISVYIKDAEVMVLPLTGGGEHDWNLILSELNILNHTMLLGNTVYYSGILIIILSLSMMLVSILMTIIKLHTVNNRGT